MAESHDDPLTDQYGLPERRFSLTTLLFIVTLAALACGTFVVSPTAGAVVLLAMPFAALATRDAVRLKALQGEKLTSLRAAAMFAISLAVVTATGVASGIAFFTVCGGWKARGEAAVIPAFGVIAGGMFGMIVGAVVFVLSAKRGGDADS